MPWQSQSCGRTFPGSQHTSGAAVVPSDEVVPGQQPGAHLAVSPSPSQSAFSTPVPVPGRHRFSRSPDRCSADGLGQVSPLYDRTLPSPSQESSIKLKSTHWQVRALWWLRLCVGFCSSRKAEFSWSSCPVLQLLLCRQSPPVKSTLLCDLHLLGSPSKARLSLGAPNSPA